MSLRVWLPLNGDLHNQGLSTVSLSGSPTWGTGKIGSKSFCCNTGITGITISDLVNVTTFSVAYWLYVDSSITDFTNYADFWELQAVSGDTTTVIRDELRTNTANLGRHALHMIKDASVGSNTNTYYGLGERDDAKDKWCHVVITKDANYCDAYADGVRYAHVACSNFENSPAKLNGKFWLGMGGCKSAYLNDFRIYDHCLSEAEIKKLAQGLILHYPLNRGGWGQENLLLDTSTPATWSKALNDSNYAVNDCFKTQTPVPSLFSVDELITISFDWSTTATGGNFHVECGAVTPWVWGTVVSSKGTRNSASNYIDITSLNKSGHVEITFKITSSQTGAADTLQWLRIRQDGTDTASKTFTISKAKLERGSIATPWCPNSSDALATTMGLNGTTEYDCSGYCNNGTRTGTFSWTSDTPKYSVSIEFQNNTSITAPSILGTTNRYQQLTFAAWIKRTSNDTTDRFYWKSTAFTTGISTYNNVSNYFDIRWNHATIDSASQHRWVTGTMQKDTWVHVTWVFNSGTWTFYQNGILSSTRNDSSTGTYLYGEIGQTSTSNWVGNVSDIRIYATALSADDVKSLYQNCATIAADGTIYGQIRS